MFGVYELLTDKWVNEPNLRALVREPSIQFDTEIAQAKAEARRFERRIIKVKNDYRKLMCLCANRHIISGWEARWYVNKKKQQLIKDFRDLVRFVDRIEKNRKMVYGIGWGVPRRNYHNIVYKYLEHGPYGDFFKKLQPLNVDEKFIL